MNEKKIIYISGTPISRVVAKKFEINGFLSQNIEVEFWNLTKIYYSSKALDLYFGGHPDYGKNDFSIEKKFISIMDVKEALTEVSSNTIFCLMDGFMQSSFWLLRSFKRNNLHYYIGPWRAIHSYEINTKPLLFKIKDSILDGTLIKKIIGSDKTNIDNLIIHRLKLFLYRSLNYYQKPEFVIGFGSVGRSQCTSMFAVNNFISIKSRDVVWEKLPNIINQSYCVYVDESIIYSPNTGLNEKTNRNSTTNDLNQFKSNMCRVFDIVEAKLGVKVIIACSGKFKYEDESIYDMREMIYGKTNQLIQHADIVLGHASTGIYQSIVDRKPLILLNDPSFIPDKQSQIPPMAKWLNVRCILTTKFSSADLDHIDRNVLNFNKIEEQYLSEKNPVKDYKKVILEKLDDLSAHGR